MGTSEALEEGEYRVLPSLYHEGKHVLCLAVHEIHDKDVDGLLQSLRYESEVMSDGVVLLRGLPFDSTEDDIADFFAGKSN